ncbi:uncharacterized protein LOC119675020 [Teleopsis dalmanni]|uniref:uncharacterized protein LOC119675020 n=1 Tax=Teleopsis dalmanni TaxID=139649 RepID=UPI0018CD84EC|nr:uncharacterized protein LOC119675020 [Teleopsis dalmanni]
MEKSNKKQRRKRTAWTENTERHLLKLWKKHVLDLRELQRNGQVFNEMAKELAAPGFAVTTNEVQKKLHDFSKRFRKEQQNIKLSGVSSSEWKYFDLIGDILRNLPLHNTNSLVCDSITDQMSSSSNCILLSPSNELLTAPSPSTLVDPLSLSTDSDCSSTKNKKIKLDDDNNIMVIEETESAPQRNLSLKSNKYHSPLPTGLPQQDNLLQELKKLNDIAKVQMEWQQKMDTAYQQIMQKNMDSLRRMSEAIKMLENGNIKQHINNQTLNETSNITISRKNEIFEIVYENTPSTETINDQITDEKSVTIVKTEYEEFDDDGVDEETRSTEAITDFTSDETSITKIKEEHEEFEYIRDSMPSEGRIISNQISDETFKIETDAFSNVSKSVLSTNQDECFPVLLTKSCRYPNL